MYVMNKKRDSLANISQCTNVYVNSEFEVRAYSSTYSTCLNLGKYETWGIACAVLNDLFAHARTDMCYQMPDDERARILARGMEDKNPDKFAGNGKKTVRRGGS